MDVSTIHDFHGSADNPSPVKRKPFLLLLHLHGSSIRRRQAINKVKRRSRRRGRPSAAAGSAGRCLPTFYSG